MKNTSTMTGASRGGSEKDLTKRSHDSRKPARTPGCVNSFIYWDPWVTFHSSPENSSWLSPQHWERSTSSSKSELVSLAPRPGLQCPSVSCHEDHILVSGNQFQIPEVDGGLGPLLGNANPLILGSPWELFGKPCHSVCATALLGPPLSCAHSILTPSPWPSKRAIAQGLRVGQPQARGFASAQTLPFPPHGVGGNEGRA